MSKITNKFAPEVRERAIRMVLDHEKDHPSRWAAVVSIAAKIGCSAPTTECRELTDCVEEVGLACVLKP